MRLVFFGLSLSSSWGNGHATTYRALLRGLAQRGHDVQFFERDQPWYAANRDLPQPDFCGLALYDSLDDLERHRDVVADADVVVIGSYVPEAAALLAWVEAQRTGLLCFYDIDTPVTLRKLEQGDFEYLSPAMIPRFDLYLSFTGGPALRVLEERYGAQRAQASGVQSTMKFTGRLAVHRVVGTLAISGPWSRPAAGAGTSVPGRGDALAAEPLCCRRSAIPSGHCLAGQCRAHPFPYRRPLARLYCASLGWTWWIFTRADMVRAGYSPSVRLFEASACGVPIVSDPWRGLDHLFQPGSEIVVAAGTEDVIAALNFPENRRQTIGAAGRRRTLLEHTGERRAQSLEVLLQDCIPAVEISTEVAD